MRILCCKSLLFATTLWNKKQRKVMEKKDFIADVILALFEKEKIYLINDLTLNDIAIIVQLSSAELESVFESLMGYTFQEMLSIWRVTHARDLYVNYNVPSKYLWRLSGFKSYKDFERNWDSVVF